MNMQLKALSLSTVLFLVLCAFFFCVCTALGIWQLQRLQWKNALIERVETRLNLPPVPAPPQSQWGQVTLESHEYRPVTIKGHFAENKDILVSTVTDYGSGYWLLTPLQQADGSYIFINRGFVPMAWRNQASRPANQSTPGQEIKITGLVRMSEGAGFFPRRNDPKRDRWYSRQLEAFALARDLENVAPYFIDADASLNQEGAPIGGLTIVTFRNTHLTYAITWFVIALGALAAFIFLVAHNKKPREQSAI